MAKNILDAIINPSGRGKVWRLFVLILLFVVFGSAVVAGDYYNRGVDWLSEKTGYSVTLPKFENGIPFRLGLDLQGGTHLVYQADMAEIPDGDRSSALDGVRDVIERRVNVFGVSEPLVQSSIAGGDYRLIVELAGISDVNEAINMIGETPLLEFKEQGAEERELTEEERNAMNEFNAEAESKANEVLEKIKAGEDFAELAKEYSDDGTKENGGDMGWIDSSSDPYTVNQIEGYQVGETNQELISSPQGYEFYKLVDRRDQANPFDETDVEKEVKASHLLICHNEVEGCDSGLSKDEAYEKIKALKEQATPENFAQLVEENTTEPGGAERKGDLGWFGKGRMVAPFEDTVFPQEVGTISYVVETQFGYHIIYKEDERTLQEYKVSRIYIQRMTEADIIGEQKEWKNTELTGKYLKRSTVQVDPNDGRYVVSLEFDSEGADLFEQITERNVGSPVAIFLDGFIISSPTVNERISGGRAVISGNFNAQEAKELVQRLNAGALPVPIELVSQQTVGASLGRASLLMSLKAGLIGILLVAIFMIIYYRLPGLLAVISLAMYGILVLTLFKLVPVTLTLAGLAGFILSIGMAVDANVLIFERFKEELAQGYSLSKAIDNAFARAWPSIRDGNISTIITCLILIWFSTSIVKGFAITLLVGVIISMISAVIITKTFMQLCDRGWLDNNKWLIGVKK